MNVKCIECGCHQTKTNDTTGEVVCIDCGLVHIEQGFEINPIHKSQKATKGKAYSTILADNHKELGTYISFNDARKSKGMALRMHQRRTNRDRTRKSRFRADAAMIISRYSTGVEARKLIDECVATYNTLREEHFFIGISLEVRAASLTYYILKDAGFKLTPSSHEKIAGGSSKKNTNWAKKIATRYRNPGVFSQSTSVSDAESIVSKLVTIGELSSFRMHSLQLVNHVDNMKQALSERMSQNDIAATIWLASKLTYSGFDQSEIRKHAQASDYGMRESVGRICVMLGIERKELRKASHAYDIKQILGGIK